MSLLMKTRTLNRLLQKEAGHAVNFVEMAEVLGGIIESNVYVISRKGKILGFSMANEFRPQDEQNLITEDRRVPPEYNDYLLRIEETASNLNREDAGNNVKDLDRTLLEQKIRHCGAGAGSRRSARHFGIDAQREAFYR